MKKIYLFLLGLLTVSASLFGQTIASEDFENSVSFFSNSGGTFYNGSSVAGDRPATSPFATSNNYGFGVSNGTATLTSNATSTIGYSSVQLSFRLASFSIGGSTNGADAPDLVKVEVSPDAGTTYYNTLTVTGNSNAYWAYSTGAGTASTAYDGDVNTVTIAPSSGGNRTADGYSTMTVTGLPQVTGLKIRITLLNNSASERWVIDDFKLTGVSSSGSPTKLVVTAISPASPYVGSGFNVTVQTQDNSNVSQNVSANTTVNLSVASGSGTLGGTLSGTIPSGSNTVTISNVTYSVAESNVSIAASDAAGILNSGNSGSFTVLANASQLMLTAAPSTGVQNSNLGTLTVEARRPDNSVATNYTGNITISKSTGPGTLSGTTTVAAVAGVASFNDLQLSQAGTYVLAASATGLTGTATGNIVISAVQSFGSGNLVIYRVGDGSAALTAAATSVYLDEYNTSGTLVQSVPLPTIVNGGNKRITASGSATSEGMLTRSADRQYIVVTGYDAAPGTASVNSTTATAVNRVVGRVDANTVVSSGTALTDASSGNNIRGAASTDGTEFWIGGGAGINYATAGATTSSQLSSLNTRSINIFNGQLYGSTASGSSLRLFTVGTGLPTSGSPTLTNLPGFPTGGSLYEYIFLDLNASIAGADVLYVVDDGVNGFMKYSLVGGSWTSNGNVSVTGNGLRGLTATVSGTSVNLYGTSPTSLYALLDASGYNGTLVATPTLLATAATNTAFRGVALAPESTAGGPLPVHFSNVTAMQKTTSVEVKWTNETEENVRSYVIERSVNGRAFSAIGEVKASRNDNSSVSYQFADVRPAAGDNFYRITAIELNGKSMVSQVVRVNTAGGRTEMLVYPNPVQGNDVNLVFNNLDAGNYTIRMYDASGRSVGERTMQHSGGSASLTLDLGKLERGVYFIEANGAQRFRKSIILQ